MWEQEDHTLELLCNKATSYNKVQNTSELQTPPTSVISVAAQSQGDTALESRLPTTLKMLCRTAVRLPQNPPGSQTCFLQ